MIPVLCVGETKEEKAAGKREEVIKRQIEKGLSLIIKSSKLTAKSLLVAYEPVWAIGTGDPEAPGSALETIRFIKEFLIINYQLSIKVLYGGSVNSKNLGDYLKYEAVDGALVGGASLMTEEIGKMVHIINE